MKYVGADLHKKTVSLCVVEWHDHSTRVVQRKRLRCDEPDQIGEFLASLGEFCITVEATIGYDWFAALAEPITVRSSVLCIPGVLRGVL
ncbi:hypothetical protein [Aeoliella mucimassa]|uniref:Uncharacterized protein n=1 Tax=Aeoliella mucimassa TaxID=2527972 RepID=A0A518AN41_9BACT|nr:hypothetical protein [Aeoliella mucimassa]QDU56147.1 hypothetical protein Pan181_23510 [Aeoliella mucimassa]